MTDFEDLVTFANSLDPDETPQYTLALSVIQTVDTWINTFLDYNKNFSAYVESKQKLLDMQEVSYFTHSQNGE